MMAGAPPRTTPQALAVERLFGELDGRLRALGLTLSFWDASGEGLSGPSVHGEFCSQLSAGGGSALAGMSQLAQKVCAEGRSETCVGPTGCYLLGVPMYQRRRLLAAAVACFPTPQTPQTEEFARACSQGHVDREYMARLCGRQARHAPGEAQTLCQIMEWLLEDQQAKEIAREELATLSTNLTGTYEELSLLYRISGSIKVTQDPGEFFRTLCEELVEVMQIESACAVLYPRDRASGTEQVVPAGSLPLQPAQVVQVVRRYLAPRVSSGARPLIDNQFSQRAAHLGAEVARVRALIAVGLMVGQNSHGILLGINKRSGEFDSADLKLITSIGGQASVFLENHHLYADLQDLLMGMLHALTASIDAKDPYTCGHSRRVALISQRLAELCEFDPARARRVYLAGLLHDVGKIGMPEAVLQKRGRLTEEEYDIVKRHPEVGARILGGIRQMEDLVPVILHHHERMDGKGYPTGLAAQEIPVEATIVALADAFDAMTSCRTYRGAMPVEAVAAEVRRCAGTQLDSRLVERLLSLDLEAFLAELRQSGSTDPQGVRP